MVRQKSVIRKRKLKNKRRRAGIQSAVTICLFLAVLVVIKAASNYFLKQGAAQENLQTSAVTAKRVVQPIQRENSQISNELEQIASNSQAAAKIYKNYNKYPEALMAAYLNNPEMEEFVLGYLQAEQTPKGGLTSDECAQEFPLLLQWDQRWGYVPYGGSVIGLSGCGPTCLSMVTVSLTGDADKTPAWMAQFSEQGGYYVKDSGTAWALMTEGAAQLGLSARELALDEFVMKSALDMGQPIICSVGEGDFTTQGHFIVIYQYNAQGFLVNDPNCIARSEQTWSFEQLQGQIKNMWAYTKN